MNRCIEFLHHTLYPVALLERAFLDVQALGEGLD